jgi:uncharacterized protein DUF4416
MKMGEENVAAKVKLFFALLFPNDEVLNRTLKRLSNDYGDIDFRSPIVFFDKTTYYEKEMGAKLFKTFVSVSPLIKVEQLPGVKLQTNKLEKLYASGDGNRVINIDPGYLSLPKIVLATTKDFDHRLYLSDNIYGEVTLHYNGKDKSYAPWPWTYPDYKEAKALEFFNELRKIYRGQLRKSL